MYPFIYIGNIEIPTYELIILCAYILGLLICIPIARQYNIAPSFLYRAWIFAAIGAVIGAKVLYMLTKLPHIIYNTSFFDISTYEKLEYLFGGYVFYGGLIGGITAVFIFCKKYHFDIESTFLTLTPIIPFTHAFGRVGCFFGGCCYGISYDGPLCVHFDENPISPHLHEVPRFPVQLLEALLNFILFIVIYRLAKKEKRIHSILQTYLICYSIERFFLEFLRGDIERGHFLLLSTSQWISILIFVGTCIYAKSKNAKHSLPTKS